VPDVARRTAAQCGVSAFAGRGVCVSELALHTPILREQASLDVSGVNGHTTAVGEVLGHVYQEWKAQREPRLCRQRKRVGCGWLHWH
jgi:hypothetical protein